MRLSLVLIDKQRSARQIKAVIQGQRCSYQVTDSWNSAPVTAEIDMPGPGLDRGRNKADIPEPRHGAAAPTTGNRDFDSGRHGLGQLKGAKLFDKLGCREAAVFAFTPLIATEDRGKAVCRQWCKKRSYAADEFGYLVGSQSRHRDLRPWGDTDPFDAEFLDRGPDRMQLGGGQGVDPIALEW